MDVSLSDLGEDRTLDPLIKSQLLYRLSYQVMVFFIGVANKRNFIEVRKVFFLSPKGRKSVKSESFLLPSFRLPVFSNFFTPQRTGLPVVSLQHRC
jgi:hypothetical protein